MIKIISYNHYTDEDIERIKKHSHKYFKLVKYYIYVPKDDGEFIIKGRNILNGKLEYVKSRCALKIWLELENVDRYLSDDEIIFAGERFYLGDS